jgi:hypothetical protein
MVMVRPSPQAEEGQYCHDHDHEADKIDYSVHFLVVSLSLMIREKAQAAGLVAAGAAIIRFALRKMPEHPNKGVRSSMRRDTGRAGSPPAFPPAVRAGSQS